MEQLPDESTEAKNSKLQCPCRIGLKFREESWHVQKLDLTHKGHKLLSARAVAREERCIKPEWVAMIKDHGALGLSPSTCLELLEKHFGDAFCNAKIEPRDISNLYYKHGYKAATDCHELVRRLREKQKEDPRWVVEVEKEPGTNRLTHLFWMTPSQVEAASRFNYLVIHDNTYNCNMFFHLGCFTTINEHGKSLLVGQALVLRERDCDYEWQVTQWLRHTPSAPKVLMTDADPACAKAVRTLLLGTKHLWCIWHIMENIRKKMARRLGKHGFQNFMSRFHDLRKEVNIKAFEEGWAALLASLLPTHQWAYTYLHNTWGGEHCKFWATCYHIDLFTNGIQSSQRGENTNRWVKALCSKVRKRCCVNKIFDAVERLVKCQMKTQERCLAIQDLKQTVEIAKKALPSAIPLVKDTLTTYALQRFLLQVDMGTTMYEVGKYDPSKLGVAAPSALDHGRFDGMPARSLDGWEPPKDLDNRQFATATVSLLPSTGCAGLPQHLAFFDPLVDGSEVLGYKQFVCTCGHQRLGEPCRHYFAVLQRGTIPVYFHIGLFHEQWFVKQPTFVAQVPMVQPSQPHLPVVECLVSRPLPTPTRDVPVLEMPPSIDENRTDEAIVANKGRMFNNLLALARKVITAAVDAGPESCAHLESGLHALGATIGAPPPPDVANPPTLPKRARGGRGNGGRGGGGGAKRQRTDTASTSAPPSEDTVPSNPVPAPYPGPPPTTTPVIPLTVAPLQNASVVPPLAPLTPQFFDTMGMASASQPFVAPAGLSQSCTQPLWQPAAFPLPFNGPMPPFMSPHHLLG